MAKQALSEQDQNVAGVNDKPVPKFGPSETEKKLQAQAAQGAENAPKVTMPEVPKGKKCGHWKEARNTNEGAFETVLTCKLEDIVPSFFSDDTDNDIFDMYMVTDPLMQHPLQEYTHTKWEVSPDACCLQRKINFVSPPQDLPLVGMVKLPVEQWHRVYWNSDKELVYRTRAQGSNAPYADTFVIDMWWIFTAVAPTQTQLKMIYDLQWVKSCWVKGIISSAAAGPAIESARAQGRLLETLARRIEEEERENVRVESEQPQAEGAKPPPKKRRSSLVRVFQELTDLQQSSIFGESKLDLTAGKSVSQNPPPAPTGLLGTASLVNLATQPIKIADLPILAQVAGGCVLLLAFLLWYLYRQLVGLEIQNMGLQHEIARLGPVIGAASLAANGTAAELWARLSEHSLAKQTHDIFTTHAVAQQLIPMYTEKVQALHGVLASLEQEQRGSGWMWVGICTMLACLPVAIHFGYLRPNMIALK